MTRFSTFEIVSLDGALALQQVDQIDHTELVEIEIAAVYGEREAVLRVGLVDLNDSNLAAWVDCDVEAVRAEMQEWLDAYMTLRLVVDYYAHPSECSSLNRILRKLLAKRDAFLAGDYVPLSSRWQVYWSSENEQGSYDGGAYDTLPDAQQAARELAVKLLGQCTDDEQCEGILSGTMDILPMVGTDGRDGEVVGDWIQTPVTEVVSTHLLAA